MDWRLTASQKFLVFWLVFIAGLGLGSRFELPLLITLWLTAIWLLIFFSGQEERLELLALILSAGFIGVATWQLTGGETWLNLSPLTHLAAELANVRDRLVDQIFLALPEPHGSLLSGILLGNRVKLDRELIQTFRLVGLSHLVAVSGYNLTILTSNIQTLFKPWLGRRSLWLSAAVILLFVLLSGAPASILRAGVMSGAVLVAQYLGRPNRAINILIFAAGILAIFEPKVIFDIGFELSLAATYGLIRLSPVIAFTLSRLRLPESITGVISETLAATLLTTPIVIAYFERLSLISPVTNVLIVPLVPLLMGLGIVGLIAVFIIPVVGRVLLLATWPLLSWIIQVSTLASRWHFAATDLTLPIWLVVLLLVAMVIGAEWLNQNPKLKLQEITVRS